LALAALLPVVAGCAVAPVRPIGDQGQPFRPEPDEQELWSQAEREAATLARTGKFWDDPRVEQYLSGIIARLAPPGMRAEGAPAVRISILRNPRVSAFALPNGRLYFHTGLLARLESEAQVATILSRALVHVSQRHALRRQRESRDGPALASAVEAPPATSAWRARGLQLALRVAVEGFGRRIEHEADGESMEGLLRGGYDPREAPEAWGRLRRDVPTDTGEMERFLHEDRRWLDRRLAGARAWLRARSATLDMSGLIRHGEDFRSTMLPVARENAALEMRAGRFEAARAQLDRVLSAAPGDAAAHLYDGDLHRLRAQRARQLDEERVLLDRAHRAYERAAAVDPGYAEPFRQLGLLHYQRGDVRGAGDALRTYLRMRPEAPDARRIREYLAEIERR
jgi:predicted Zn-dependent protease